MSSISDFLFSTAQRYQSASDNVLIVRELQAPFLHLPLSHVEWEDAEDSEVEGNWNLSKRL